MGGLRLGDGDRVHHDGLDRLVVAVGLDVANLEDHVHARHHLAEHGVLGRGGAVEPVEETVVHRVDEELGAAAVGLSGVGHGEGPGLVGNLGDELVGDVATTVARHCLAVRGLVAGAAVGPARARAAALGVLAVRAPAKENQRKRERRVP